MKKAISIILGMMILTSVFGCKQDTLTPETNDTQSAASIDVVEILNNTDEINVIKNDKKIKINKSDENYKKIVDCIQNSNQEEIFKNFKQIDSSYNLDAMKSNNHYYIQLKYNQPQEFIINEKTESEKKIDNINYIWLDIDFNQEKNMCLVFSKDDTFTDEYYAVKGPVNLSPKCKSTIDDILK